MLLWCLMAMAWQQQTSEADQLHAALALAKAHQYAQAEKVLEGVAVPADPPRAIAFHRLRASIEAGLLRYVEADSEMRAALALAPENQQLRRAAAVTAAAAGDSEERDGENMAALRSYERAVELDPSQERYRLLLAIELLQHRTFEPALLVLHKAETDLGKSARLETALGVAYFASGESFEKAADSFLEALQIEPEFTPARNYLFETVLAERELPSEPVLQSVCGYADRYATDGHANAVCGALLLRSAEAGEHASLAAVVARLEKASAQAPADPLARCQYGKALAKSEQWQAARVELEACVGLDPKSAEGHFRLMGVYSRLNLPVLAKREAQRKQAADRATLESNDKRDQTTNQFLYTLRDSSKADGR